MRIKELILSSNSKNYLPVALFVFLLIPIHIYASFELSGNSARSQAMGQAYVGLANTPDAIFMNCSGVAQLSDMNLSIYYTRPFGMKELNYGSLAAIVPTSIASFGAGLISFGNETYREQSLIVTINRSAKQNFYYGLNLHYMKLQISDYGSDFSFGIDAGFLIKMTPKFNWGFFASNLNRTKIGRANDSLPQTFCTGIAIFPVSDLILNLDIFKDSMFPVELRCGMEYLLFNRIALRTGFTTEPAQFCAGFGFLFSLSEVNYAVTTHPNLGLTHHLSLQLQLKKRKEPTAKSIDKLIVEPEFILKLNINTATQKQLQQLPGIGAVLAQRIIEYRNQVGNFKTLEELCKIKGFSKAKLQRIMPYIILE